jgi:hypothetical protein
VVQFQICSAATTCFPGRSRPENSDHQVPSATRRCRWIYGRRRQRRSAHIGLASTSSVPRMGPLEFAVYKADWMASRIYLRHIADVAARRELEAAAKAAQDQIMKAAGRKPDRSGDASSFKSARRGSSGLRSPLPADDDDAPDSNKLFPRRSSRFSGRW